MWTRRVHLPGWSIRRFLQRSLPTARDAHRRDGMRMRSSGVRGLTTLDVGQVSFFERWGKSQPRLVVRQKENVMSTTGWIILIIVVLLLFGGFGFARRGR